MASTGLPWLASTMPSSAQWGSVAFGNGVFVAIEVVQPPNTTTTAAVSSDGINWSASTLPSSLRWTQIAFGNGIFMVVSSSVVATSSNGTSWSTHALTNTGNGWDTLACGGSTWIVEGSLVGTPHNYNLYSTNNGSTWVHSNTGLFPSYTPYQTAAGGGLFIKSAGEVGLSLYYYGTDGINWTLAQPTHWGNPTVAYDPVSGYFVAQGTGGTSGRNLWYSANLTVASWNFSVALLDQNVCCGGGYWLTFGPVGTESSFSTDTGATWTPVTTYPMPFSLPWIGCWGNPTGSPSYGMFVAMGSAGNNAATSHAAYTTVGGGQLVMPF